MRCLEEKLESNLYGLCVNMGRDSPMTGRRDANHHHLAEMHQDPVVVDVSSAGYGSVPLPFGLFSHSVYWLPQTGLQLPLTPSGRWDYGSPDTPGWLPGLHASAPPETGQNHEVVIACSAGCNEMEPREERPQ